MIVHSSQPIFRLLDPHRIQVRGQDQRVTGRARIQPGQPVLIHLEAFPDHRLLGSVAQIVPIPAVTNGLYSGVRSFFATVRIDSGGFDALTTGLTAELEFLVETRRHVTRLPLEAIRWVGDCSFAATLISTTTGVDDWQWRPIVLGASSTNFAEVTSGLKPGDRVIAQSDTLPAPRVGHPPFPRKPWTSSWNETRRVVN